MKYVFKNYVVKILALLFILSSNAYAQESPPNIIFFLTDDQGWDHHSVPMFEDEPSTNNGYFKTPNIERIANSGMRFSNAYAAAPMCNPSRRSLHVGQSIAQVLFTGKSEREQAAALTIGEMMQTAGYQTAHFGKWSPGPSESGLDYYNVTDGRLGNAAGNQNDPDDPKQIFGITDRAIDFMQESVAAGEPFYMQISHFAPHTGPEALQETLQAWRESASARRRNIEISAMTQDLDTGVGMVLDELEKLGVDNNTYVFYTSDHGQTTRILNHDPLTSGKGTLWEGGIRVPFIVSGPGIEQGSISHERVVSIDLFPTFANLANVDQALPSEIEGGDLLPVLQGLEQGKVDRGREELIFHFPSGSGQADFRPMSAIYLGDYKMVKLYDTDEKMLFNITEDLGEKDNLAKELPAKVDEMDALLVSYFDEMGVTDFGSSARGDQGNRPAGNQRNRQGRNN